MIELVAVGKCDGCPAVEPVVGILYAGSRAEARVKCKNQELCDRIEDHLIEILKADQAGEK